MGVSISDARLHALDALYREVHAYAADRDLGPTPFAPRQPELRSLEGDVLLLAQGLAKGTQRVTGYPYRGPRGLSPAGRRLDAFLRPLGYTIDHTKTQRTFAYSTDLVPWFPGKTADRRHDVLPTEDDVAACWSWFEREVELLKPKVVVLLGGAAGRFFLNRYAGIRISGARPALPDLVGRRFHASVVSSSMLAVVTYHPAAAWGSLGVRAERAFQSAQQVIRDASLLDRA